MGLDPGVGVGRSEESPSWDWKSLGSRDRAGSARPAVAGEEGEELRALCRSSARAPVALGLLPGWALLRVCARSLRPPELPWFRLQKPSTQALAAVEEIMEGVFRVRLFSTSLFTIWRLAFKLYFYSQRHFGCIYDSQTSLGEWWEYPKRPFCRSFSGIGAGISPLWSLSLPPPAPCCLSELPPSPRPTLPPLRKSGRVRQLKLPLGTYFTSLLRIGEPFAAKFFAAGERLFAVAPREDF